LHLIFRFLSIWFQLQQPYSHLSFCLNFLLILTPQREGQHFSSISTQHIAVGRKVKSKGLRIQQMEATIQKDTKFVNSVQQQSTLPQHINVFPSGRHLLGPHSGNTLQPFPLIFMASVGSKLIYRCMLWALVMAKEWGVDLFQNLISISFFLICVLRSNARRTNHPRWADCRTSGRTIGNKGPNRDPIDTRSRPSQCKAGGTLGG